MAEHQYTWPVSVLCEVLEVSRSGFYAYLPRHTRTEIDAEDVAQAGPGQDLAAVAEAVNKGVLTDEISAANNHDPDFEV